MVQDVLLIGDWIARELSDRAEALLGGLITNAHYGRNIHLVMDLPVEDLQVIALTAYDRGFGDGKRPSTYDCYSICDRFPELHEKNKPLLEALYEDKPVPGRVEHFPTAEERIDGLIATHGRAWYGRELLRHVLAEGVLEVAGDGLYRLSTA